MEKLLLFVAGIATAGIGYLLKRWWEGQGTRDKVQDLTNLAKLHKEMKEQSVSVESLERLRKEMFDRNKIRVRDEEAVVDSIERALELDHVDTGIEGALQSQYEMNEYAFHLADLAKRELNYLATALENKLDEKEADYFRKSQRAWDKYAQSQAAFSSLACDGGSMQPLIHASELRTLYIERAAALKDAIRERAEDVSREA